MRNYYYQIFTSHSRQRVLIKTGIIEAYSENEARKIIKKYFKCIPKTPIVPKNPKIRFILSWDN